MSLSRRLFIALASVASAPSFMSSAKAEEPGIPAKIVPAPESDVAKRRPFMIGTSMCSVVWRDPPDCAPVWSMNSRDDGVRWYNDGPLNEQGRMLLIEHFGLDKMAEELTVESLNEQSPYHLVHLRRWLERKYGLPHLTIDQSTCIGQHFKPEQCI